MTTEASTSPRPARHDPQAEAWPSIADFKRCYETFAADDRELRLDVTQWSSLRYLARFVRTTSDDVVLDLGAGAGELLASLPGRRIAYDISETCLAEAAERGLSVVCGLGERLPLPDASIDVLIASMVLEHVLDLPRTLAEIRRVVRPGGRFYMQVPYREDLSGYEAVSHIPGHEFSHLRSFDEEALGDVMRGFEVVRRRFLLYPAGSGRRPLHALKSWMARRLPRLHASLKRALGRGAKRAVSGARPCRTKDEYLRMASRRRYGRLRHFLNYVPRPLLAPFLRPYSIVIEGRRTREPQRG